MHTFLLALLVVLGSGDDVPEALSKAIGRRISFKTAYFEYEFESRIPGVWDSPRHRYEARFAGDSNNKASVYWTEFGDADGIVARDGITGKPRLGVAYSCSPSRTVRCNDGRDQWSIHDGELLLHMRPTPNRISNLMGRAPEKLLDPRSAGIFPRAYSERTPSDWIEVLQSMQRTWTTRVEEGRIIVTGSTSAADSPDGSQVVTEWKIDPKMDDAILEVSNFKKKAGGATELIECVKTSYRKVDGRWWPEQCLTRFERGGSEVFSITKIEFDRRDHPAVIGPELLGAPPGLKAIQRLSDGPGPAEKIQGMYVGGGSIVSTDEWIKTYRAQFDPDELSAYVERARTIGNGAFPTWWHADDQSMGLENPSTSPDLWEAYVRRWIFRHSNLAVRRPNQRADRDSHELTESQIESAWAVLKSCRSEAKPIVERMRKDDAAGDSAAVAKGPASEKSDKGESSPAGRVVRCRVELASIFKKLCTRLDALLTTRQQVEEAKAGRKGE